METQMETQIKTERKIWTMGLSDMSGGLTGSTLKLIAIVTMIIDHTGVAVIGRLLRAAVTQTQYNQLRICYEVFRYIGRIAFPIYCFLLVEGFFRTRDVRKYLLRLFAFALLSEIPYDLASKSMLWDWTHQNVFFELAVGVLAMWGIRAVTAKTKGKLWQIAGTVAVTAVAAGFAWKMRLDYGAVGVVCIVALYLSAGHRIVQSVVGGFCFAWELTAPLAFLCTAQYNGKRGIRLKYVFYLVYPLHLLILYLIAVCMGVGSYAGV